MANKVQYYGTGRRKESVARVRLVPGNGTITINAIGEIKSDVSITSDGSSSVFRTVPIINGSVKFSLSVASGTEIYDVKYKASVC